MKMVNILIDGEVIATVPSSGYTFNTFKNNDVGNVICNWLILHGYAKKTPYEYNAKVLLSAFEMVRNREFLSVEEFRFVIENLPDVYINSLEMLDKSKALYKQFSGVMDGEKIMVEDFVKELFS